MFFKKRREEEIKQADKRADKIRQLREFRDIGERFTYLGRDMVVTAHYRIVSCGFSMHPVFGISADYVNDIGDIKQISFSMSELQTLINENKE